MPARWLRVLRGTLTAHVAVLVALLSHVGGGGARPGALAVVVALTFAVPLCVALAGRGLSLARLTASVGASQAVLHVLFGLGLAAGTTGVPVTAGRAGPFDAPGGHDHAPLVLHAVDGLPAFAVPSLDAAMLGGHLAAALLTVLAVRRGERALLRLVHLAGGALRAVALLRWRPRPTGPRLRPLGRPAVAPVEGRFLVALPRRGPPGRVAPVAA